MEVSVNYLAVLLAALSSMVIGSIWYAQSVFGKIWAKLAKVKMDRKPAASEMTILLSLTFIASLITAYVLAHVAFLSHAFFKSHTFLQDALSTAFWLWLGLTAARIFVHDAFESRPWKLTVLTVGHELVTLLMMGVIIGLFGVK
jgi:Protein of unknown function (DUF1761)